MGGVMEKTDYKVLAARIFCYGALALLLFIFLKYCLGYVLPFLIAWGIAYLIYPLAYKLSKKTKLSRKICSFVLVLLILLVILMLLFFIGNRIFYEIQGLLSYLTENSAEIAGHVEGVFDFASSLTEKIPFLNNLQDSGLIEKIKENINLFITEIWQSLIAGLGSAIPDFAAGLVSALPNAFLVGLVGVISCFYFALDIEELNLKLKSVLPEWVLIKLRLFKRKMTFGFKRYIKAYMILFSVTFVELFVGFLILGIDYAFGLALLISFVDFLPLFGTGAVLLPWGIVLLFMKKYFMGFGILILLLIITVIRQIIEPKIVGKSLGIHPILTLASLYIGFNVYGIVGMIFFPIIMMIIFAKEEKVEKQ
jgi:sporulation integral membrane protein YtvI